MPEHQDGNWKQFISIPNLLFKLFTFNYSSCALNLNMRVSKGKHLHMMSGLDNPSAMCSYREFGAPWLSRNSGVFPNTIKLMGIEQSVHMFYIIIQFGPHSENRNYGKPKQANRLTDNQTKLCELHNNHCVDNFGERIYEAHTNL